MHFTYVPKLVREKGWKGSITVDLLTFDERMDMGELANAAQKTDENLKYMRSLIVFCNKKYVKVDLIRPDGIKASSIDDLISGGKVCHDLLQEVAFGQMNGFEEGN